MGFVRASRRGPFRPKLGQHFLKSGDVVERILRAVGAGSGDAVVEIGPGRGALTAPLLAAGIHVLAFELDDTLASRLEREHEGSSLVVHRGDALDADFGAILGEASATVPLPLVGNLPYGAATPMIRAFVRRADLFSRLVVMVQLEVADRLVAGPRDKAYGFLTLDVGAHAGGRKLFDVPRTSFEPPPKVISSVVELIPHPPRPGTEGALAVASAGFTTRRKTLVNSLAALWGREKALETVQGLDLLPTVRAEELPLETFYALSERLGPRRGVDRAATIP